VHEQILPQIMQDYVTPGKAYLVFRDYVHDRRRSPVLAARRHLRRRRGSHRQVSGCRRRAIQGAGRMGDQRPDLAKHLQFVHGGRTEKDPDAGERSVVATDVQNDIDAGNMVPVQQTPTMVVIYKGKKQPWAMWNSYPLLKSYLDTLLAGK